MGMLSEGFDMLQEVQHDEASEQITYTRGGTSVTLTAVLGSFLFKVSDGMGTQIEHSDLDFIVSTSALVAAGLGKPQRNDRIARSFAGGTQTYSVWAPGDERPYKAIEDGRRLQIHTVLVGGSA